MMALSEAEMLGNLRSSIVHFMLYPLRFKPLFRRYLWGGRRLESVLGKPIGDGDDYAESWEIVDHGADQSVVAYGPLDGTPLHDLVTQHGKSLFGRHHPQTQFPLLFKFLDAQRDLSVQVHPNDEQAAELDPPDLGKTEAWVILDAQPGSMLYAGLRPGIDRDELAQRIRQGETTSCLHRIEARVGDCLFVPAGIVHALGAGIVIAEIQQASDTTYRLYDWDRVGADGKPRQLHVEQALNVIRFDARPVEPQQPATTNDADVSRLVACDKFVLDRWEFDQAKTIPDDSRCRLIAVLSGCVEVEHDPAGSSLSRGQTMLVTADVGDIRIQPLEKSVLLVMYLP